MSTIETAAKRSDAGTYRPRKQPITDKGTAFEPFHVIYRDPQIRNLPATILELFRLFVPEFLVVQWVKWTSDYMESTQYSETLKPQSRTKQWIPTSTAEVYIFLAILISMSIHAESTISNDWAIPTEDQEIPFYSFKRHMTYNCFFLLFRHLRLFNLQDCTPTSCTTMPLI